MKFKTVQASQVTLTQLMLPSHSNFSGKIHGGFVLSLMDQIAFSCASRHSGHYCVTASVNKVDFLHPIEVGELLTLKSSINYTGNTSMVVGVRVESENIKTGKVTHCNSSYFTMVAKDDSGNNAQIPGIILSTPDCVRRFSRSILRKELAREHSADFKRENFVINNYLDKLTSQNAKVELSE